MHAASLLSLWVTLTISNGRPRSCGSFAFPDDNEVTGTRSLTIVARLPGISPGDPNFLLGRSTAALALLDDEGMC